MDIETASDLTGKSRTKLAQAKSKRLIRTLTSEALTSNRTWEEIKDSPHLKICNSDIHTSVSHCMEIQQKEKESLAAYIHCFKREASRSDHVHRTKTTAQHHQNHLTIPTGQPEKTRIRNINKSPLMTHHLNITALMNHPANLMRI